MRIYLELPLGKFHGWGICGRYLAKAIGAVNGVVQTRLITDHLAIDNVDDELELHHLSRLHAKIGDILKLLGKNQNKRLSAPLLKGISNNERFVSQHPRLRGTPTVGYTFYLEL